METILRRHLQRLPHMQPQDAVKLVFQSAFGCGHLLASREACAQRIEQEMDVTPVVQHAPAYEPIGGGLCRLQLASPAVRALSPLRIADLMRLTAEDAPGDAALFEQGLAQLECMATQGLTPFSSDALQNYLAQYRAQGCPVVSHSPAYRAAYAPAYRVASQQLALLLPVVQAVDGGRGTVVIDGMCGSGKTTLANLLARLYGTQPIRMDDFFLPYNMRTPQRLAQPGGNVHHERFLQEVLLPLVHGGDVYYRRFDCHTDQWQPRLHRASAVTIIEGSYSHHPAFAQALGQLDALRVFVCVDEAEQLRRIAARDPELLGMFQNRWIPLEKTYFEAYDSKNGADIVIDTQPCA